MCHCRDTSKTAAPVPMRWAVLNWPAKARCGVTSASLLLVTWLLLAPARTFNNFHTVIPGEDKVVHAAIFCILSAMVRWAAPGGWGAGWRRSGMIAALAAYGTGIESLQPFVPNAGRTFDWADLLMNVAGVILGAWLCERLVADGGSQAAPAPP